jgi:hypothetical protein
MSEKSFPTYFTEDHALSMTLRDYFAAKAIAVVMPPVLEEIRSRRISDADVTKLKRVSAEACYGIADEMLEARK